MAIDLPYIQVVLRKDIIYDIKYCLKEFMTWYVSTVYQ